MNLLICQVLTTLAILHHPMKDSTIKQEIDSLKFMNPDSLSCNASLYWKIISHGRQAIPLLIERLDDSTLTNQFFHCKDSKLTVGDICYFAIDNIVELPTAYIFPRQFDLFDEHDCWSFYYYLFDNKNKAEIKKYMQKWYPRNKGKFKWEKYNHPPFYRSYPYLFDLWDCIERYGVKGRYMYQSNN